jgi:hypothetical protein
MPAGPINDLLEEAVLDGGPMDGSRRGVDVEAIELYVEMTDGQRHVYVRTDAFQATEDGNLALVFRWNGRR